MSAIDQRMSQVFQIDPEWGERVVAFVANHPEFRPYLHLTPLTRGPVKEPGYPTNVYEMILYCMASAGCRADYGFQLYRKLIEFFAAQPNPPSSYPFKVPANKQQWIAALHAKMHAHSLTPQTLTFAQFVALDFAKVKGIGQTTVAYVHAEYGDDWRMLPLTDLWFVRGMHQVAPTSSTPSPLGVPRDWRRSRLHVAGATSKLTPKQLKELAQTWDDDPQVARGLVSNISTYGLPQRQAQN